MPDLTWQHWRTLIMIRSKTARYKGYLGQPDHVIHDPEVHHGSELKHVHSLNPVHGLVVVCGIIRIFGKLNALITFLRLTPSVRVFRRPKHLRPPPKAVIKEAALATQRQHIKTREESIKISSKTRGIEN